MSLQSFVPALWAGRLLANLNDAHVYKQCCNTDYEGEIKGQGSSVRINSIGRVTVSSYNRNTSIGTPETLDLEAQMLVIDQAKYFNFMVDDVDKVQMKASIMDAAMKEAAWGLADACDAAIAAYVVGQVASATTMTAATIGYGAGEKEPYDLFLEADIELTETNTPRAGRWAVVPPWMEAYVRKAEGFVANGTSENISTLKRGEPIGSLAGFDIRVSNNVPTSGSAYQVLFGYNGALSFAEQIMKTEAYQPESYFADAVKGLHVYGYKVTRPSNLALINATRGNLS